jgi:hypothetical protein
MRRKLQRVVRSPQKNWRRRPPDRGAIPQRGQQIKLNRTERKHLFHPIRLTEGGGARLDLLVPAMSAAPSCCRRPVCRMTGCLDARQLVRALDRP